MVYADTGSNDIPAGWLAVAIPIAGLLGAGIKWLLEKLVTTWQSKRAAETQDAATRRANKLQDEDRMIVHLNALVQRQDDERVADREEFRKAEEGWNERQARLELQVAQLIEVLRRTEARLAGAISWMRSMEAIMDEKKIRLPKWQDPDPGMMHPRSAGPDAQA